MTSVAVQKIVDSSNNGENMSLTVPPPEEEARGLIHAAGADYGTTESMDVKA